MSYSSTPNSADWSQVVPDIFAVHDEVCIDLDEYGGTVFLEAIIERTNGALMKAQGRYAKVFWSGCCDPVEGWSLWHLYSSLGLLR